MKQTMRAELAPDVYAGETCDQIEHRWIGSCEGDKDGDGLVGEDDCLKLAANTFPPGTVVAIHEPECPACGAVRYPDTTAEPITWPSKCDCGFDWDEWTRDRYS